MLARGVFKERVVARGQRLQEASHSILSRLERQSKESVTRLLGQDRNMLTVDAGPCLRRLAHRVNNMENEAVESSDIHATYNGLVDEGGLTPEQLLGMPFLQAIPLFLAAAESNVNFAMQNISPPRAKTFLDRSSPISLSIESSIHPANKASTPRRCNKSTGEDVGNHFGHEDYVNPNKQFQEADLDDGSSEGRESPTETVENISDLVAQARSLLTAARHQFHSNPKPSGLTPVAKKAEAPLELLQPTLAQSNAAATTRHPISRQGASTSGDGEHRRLDEQLFGEDDEVISPIKTNKSVESWDWTDSW